MRHFSQTLSLAGTVALLVTCLAARSQAADASSAPRPFAPGVLTTIPPDLKPDETVSTHDVVEIHTDPNVRWKPELMAESKTLYGMSGDVKFRRAIWCLEFSFKPLRMIHVDVPQANGKIENKLVWYMVYSVKNTGRTLAPVQQKDGVYTEEIGKGGPVRFIPSFVLQSQDRQPNGERIDKEYLDRLIPAAYDAIRARESHDHPLLNSAQMATQLIPVSDERADRSVWGYVTWVDIDPRIDFFSIFVGGLTNAYQWTDPPGAYKTGDELLTGREFKRKMLQLNFWRPGDEFGQDETAIRYGAARGKANLYDVFEGVAYRWVYR
jgi:hypothetical protein